MTNFNRIKNLFVFGMLLLLYACEEEFIPEISTDPEDIVVEGYIEAGDIPLPPYVILTRSLPFFTTFGFGDLDNLFVHDAIVTVSDGEQTVTLEELCWNDFDEEVQALLQELLEQSGVGLDTIPGNLCVYFDRTLSMIGETGKTYDLRIEAEDKVLTASTSIPEPVLIDSLKFIKPSGVLPDTLLELRGFFSDPPGVNNFYRYFNSINGGRFIPGFNSVVDDAFFDGQQFEFPIPKAEPRNTTADPAEFGLHRVGDTLILKWSTIDDAHFRFWSTLEFNAVNQGPFSAYSRVETNINGGIGVWGGYNSGYYNLIVEEE